MKRPIGYYVHHQGAGHLHRARLIARVLDRPCTLIGTFAADIVGDAAIDLPDDRLDIGFDGDDGASSRPEAFHYAPLNHDGVRLRMAAIAAWVGANDPALMIVDVSVEVTLLARLLSIPVLTVRLAGRRTDQPHLEAFRASQALLCPFPPAFESPATPDWVRDKTIYAGFLAPAASVDGIVAAYKGIAVIIGRGGAAVSIAHLVDAAQATPDWTWNVYGQISRDECNLPSNLHVHGWVDSISTDIDRAMIIVGGAGDGLLSTIAARGKRFVCLPEARSFDEQTEKASVLAAMDLAVVLPQWPDAADWPSILARAMALDPRRLQAFYDADAVSKTAAAIEALISPSNHPE